VTQRQLRRAQWIRSWIQVVTFNGRWLDLQHNTVIVSLQAVSRALVLQCSGMKPTIDHREPLLVCR